MKQFITLLLLAATFALQAQDKPQNFKGTITNNKEDSLIVSGLTSTFRIAIPIDKQGRFSVSIQQGAKIFSLEYAEVQLPIFLSNDTDLTLTANGKDFENTLALEGEGTRENNIIRTMEKEASAFETTAALETNPEVLRQKATALYGSWNDKIKEGKFDFAGSGVIRMMLFLQKKRINDAVDQAESKLKYNGKPSPQFSYKDVHGKVVNLSDFKGKYVYIDVWATWCGPCRQEIPHLQKLEESLKGKKIAFVSLSIDKPEDTDKWKKMVADKQLGGTQLIAENAWDSTFVKDYCIVSIPRFILIDPKGIIVDSDTLRPSEPELLERLNKLLK